MRGLKAALVARSQSERVSFSVLVRVAVARGLGLSASNASSAGCVKLSIRMTSDEAERLTAGAREAGLWRGAYLAGLIADVPVLSAGVKRADHLATLIASSAEHSGGIAVLGHAVAAEIGEMG